MTRRVVVGVASAVLALCCGGAVVAVHALSSSGRPSHAAVPAAVPAVAPVTQAPRVAVAPVVPATPVLPVSPTSTKPVAAHRAKTTVVRTRSRVLTVHSAAPAPPVRRSTVPKAAVKKAETPTQRGTRVLNSLHYDWKRLGYTIVFKPERAHYLGLTDSGTKTITIWVRTAQSDLVLAHTIAHELGHALDFSHGDAAKHKAYLSLRGLNPLTPWYGCDGCTDYSSPAGDWAEVFAYYLAGPGDFRSQMAKAPSATQMKAIALLYKY